MKVIGISGGIASGKSAVAQAFAEEGGGTVISADQLGHEVLATDDFKSRAFDEWGASVFQKKGLPRTDAAMPSAPPLSSQEESWKDLEIDRKGLAASVFDPNDAEARHLKRLNAMTHPAIARRVAERIRQSRASGAQLVILDAPLLYEVGMESLCDAVVFVDTDLNIRRTRVESRGWPVGELARREKNQFPTEVKRAAADFVLKNNGDFQETRRQIPEILNKIGISKT